MHTVFTEAINKIVLSGDDEKRKQTAGEVISYPYGTGPGILCKIELMRHPEIKTRKWKKI